MKLTPHPGRKTAFTKTLEKDGWIHALIKKASPWHNGIIERSNQNQYRLWEMQYNCHCPHQGIGNQIPLQIYKEQYLLHARSRML